MMHEYLSFPDETTIAFSDVREDGTIRVVVERPRDWGFDSAICILPGAKWMSVDGFSTKEADEFQSMLQSSAPLLFELASTDSKDEACA